MKDRFISYLKTLSHLGKFRVTDSGPTLMDQHVMIVPRDLFVQLIELYEDDPVLERAVYRVMQNSVYDFCDELDADGTMDPAEMLQTLMQLGKLNGYGQVEISEYDREANRAVFLVRNLPSEAVGNSVVFKGDTYWAGMLAGGMSYVFGRDVECVETQCVLEDNTSCRFEVAPGPVLERRHPELYETKLGSPTGMQGVATGMQRAIKAFSKGDARGA